MKHAIRPLAAIALVLLAACSSSSYSSWTRANDPARDTRAKAARAVKVTEDSFRCIREMTQVRGFFVDNLLGDVADTLGAANHPFGGKWPPGSVVMRIPTEAMVKHKPGFNPATNDWEFFDLDIRRKSTRIRARGFTNVVNQFGGNCLTCHQEAEPRWDMICEQGHGCAPNLVTPVMAVALQNSDSRCRKISLPPEQKAALEQFMALSTSTRSASLTGR
jgi:hypothetical protein